MSTHRQIVANYVDGVTSGRIVTGRLARLAVWRYLDDLEHAGQRGYEFKESYANEFLDFQPLCCHTQGEWDRKPFIASPWQTFIDWNIFGWRRKDDGTRRFRKDYEEIARKNGKTTRCGPKCFYLSFMDNPIEQGGQGYCAATKEDQAKLLFDELKRMIEVSPGLRPYCNSFQRRITFPSTQSYMQVLGSDSKGQDGYNPHFIVRDELHAWQERHRGLAEKLDTGFGSRRQPLMITITTAGDENSIIWIEEHEYAERVLESVITGEIVDDTFFAFICSIDYREADCFRCKGEDCPWCGGTGTIPADDPFDENVWPKANPNIGISAKIDRIRELANEAKHKPTSLNKLLRYYLNVRVSSTAKLITAETWAACRGKLSDWSTATTIHGAFDLGRRNDMAGAAVVAQFNETDDDGVEFQRYEIRGKAWTCENRDDEVKTEQVARWIRDGLLEECDGNQVLFSEIEDWMVAHTPIYGIKTWAYDPSFATVIGQNLQEVHGLQVFPFTQAPVHYNEPTRTLERLVKQVNIVDGKAVRGITHDGDPVLSWMMCNLIVRKNAKDQWMPDKGASPQKIDLAVSGLMALSECLFVSRDTSDTWNFKPGTLGL